jgi:outer membrane protein assembly factor BamB
MIVRALLTLLSLTPSLGFAIAAEPGPWATYRGNSQRTANTDNQPGPEKPAVLWVVKSQDHYVASPVPVGSNVYLSALGAFNRPTVNLFPVASSGEPKPVWTRSAPYLRLASVSSPAVSGNFLVFGDGMHQDSGGLLHCLTADTGRPVWQLPLPGDLIHLEGAPTILDGKVFMGGGAAGVFAVDLKKATLDGKEVTPEEVARLQDLKWKELLRKYEETKKKDPDFAVPPNEDQLLKPAPKSLWKKGEKKWHVDAPVNVSGDNVLVCSSYLDQEKVGERALYCLNVADGETKWTQPLKLNPWGGASISGNTVVVTGSSVGYYYTQLKGAKGDIFAFDLTNGTPKWRKEIPGGVVGCASISNDLVVCTATDGKVRAFALADGERRWIYDAKTPLFAPPCISGGSVYVGDLQGQIHAIELSTGTAKWKLDLGNDPAVKSPGMVYGGVIAQGGKLIVATCNLEGPLARKPTAVVCIGTK